MKKIMDLFVLLTLTVFNTAFIFTFEVQKTQNVYVYIVFPAIISGIILSIYSIDIKKSLILSIFIILLSSILLSLFYSLPAFLGIIAEDLVNPFIFLSVKKAVNNVLIMILPLIISTLIASTIISGFME